MKQRQTIKKGMALLFQRQNQRRAAHGQKRKPKRGKTEWIEKKIGGRIYYVRVNADV